MKCLPDNSEQCLHACPHAFINKDGIDVIHRHKRLAWARLGTRGRKDGGEVGVPGASGWGGGESFLDKKTQVTLSVHFTC